MGEKGRSGGSRGLKELEKAGRLMTADDEMGKE